MSWAMAVGAGIAGVSALVKHSQAKSAETAARNAARKAQRELDEQKDKFENLDTSNPYLNMENVMEDLTVDTQAAEFGRDQAMASQANIMQQMRGAAGGSGIAALAQTLASQGSIDAQKSQAMIAQQEQANTMAERGEAARIQGLEREGELISRQAQFGKISSLMGMSADDVSVQRQAQALAMQQKQAATQEMIGAGAQVGMGVAAGTGAIDAQQFGDFKDFTGGVGGGAPAVANGTPGYNPDGSYGLWNGQMYV